MYKTILAAVTILSFSQVANAADKSEIWQCMDDKTISVKEDCMVSTIEKHTESTDFFDKLARKQILQKGDAYSTVTYFPAQNLIQVKSIETKTDLLLAARK
ncbi:hypothetical protein [Thalassotalea eurytherma]|uniref:Uncharacterized protein n=1 Tax=Thalassotalea eurytherma TaxID=1144278 RepID=A0ABQ6H7B9_9GAMM|nr:hypothetical protein [Thalassotalea eurytherma]GLX83527.1 hypothetical protein theurythT_29800 [Thalassotalea eurytherma]